MKKRNKPFLLETDAFPFEFLSQLAERESWRKEIHRPIYHVHKWWAKRLGSVFRGILLGAALPDTTDLSSEFYQTHSLTHLTVFDPFMGSGTTVGEAHKLGMTALGRDINPVAVQAVRTALGRMDESMLGKVFDELASDVGKRLRGLYTSIDRTGQPCDVLYHFWVMQASCPDCSQQIDLFPSYIFARNAYPDRKPEVQIVCPACGDIFKGLNTQEQVSCPSCVHQFNPNLAPASGAKATCSKCGTFSILKALGSSRPTFRHYAKLVLTADGDKQYLPATAADRESFDRCAAVLEEEVRSGRIRLPSLGLTDGYNTRQAISYNFRTWVDFFNQRQLLALGWLHAAIEKIEDADARRMLLTLFSGTLEFNNLFASYKGEGTGAVRHMFSHHILKPERTPIEANVWGTQKSSGSFSTLLRGRLLRAIEYRKQPTEVNAASSPGRVCSLPFTGKVEHAWPTTPESGKRRIYLSQGDSAHTELRDRSVDIVVTDPPFFDNVHYSELADFFFAWQQLSGDARDDASTSTRACGEVQDADAVRFATKLQDVFAECSRVLKDDGLMVFTYHHSRNEGWVAVADAISKAGFSVVNAHPVRAEMSVATPKAQAKEPINLDIIIVCKKKFDDLLFAAASPDAAVAAAQSKIARLESSGFKLSRNDRRIVLFGQLLTATSDGAEIQRLGARVETQLDAVATAAVA